MAWVPVTNLRGPTGPTGPAGAGVQYQGSVADGTALGLLPGPHEPGDMYITLDDGHAHIWNDSTNQFDDIGPFLGQPGPTGQTGPTGTAATLTAGTTTTTGAGGTAAVTNSGTPSAAVFDFIIPQGHTGASGATGTRGSIWTSGGSGAPATAGTELVHDHHLDVHGAVFEWA